MSETTRADITVEILHFFNEEDGTETVINQQHLKEILCWEKQRWRVCEAMVLHNSAYLKAKKDVLFKKPYCEEIARIANDLRPPYVEITVEDVMWELTQFIEYGEQVEKALKHFNEDMENEQ